MDLRIIRLEDLPLGGVFGTMVPSGLFTVEENWLQNRKGRSCIPAGVYQVRRTRTPKHGECFMVCDVPNRDAILIHPANTENDIEGCIGVGLRRGHLWLVDEDSPAHLAHPPGTTCNCPRVEHAAVVESKVAYDAFMAMMHGIDVATLTIEWAQGKEPSA